MISRSLSYSFGQHHPIFAYGTTDKGKMSKNALVCLHLAILFVCSVSGDTFQNPIKDGDAPDPWIYRHANGKYYLTHTLYDRLEIFESERLENWRDAKSSVIYQPDPNIYREIWAPEIHLITGDLYIYFTMASVTEDHRMHVMKANDPNDLLGNWTFEGKIYDSARDWWAIDASVLQHEASGKNYLLYAGKFDLRPDGTVDWPLQLLIAELATPTSIVANSSWALNKPTLPWETVSGGVSEGPVVVPSGDHYYVIFAATSTWSDEYCLGMMRIKKTDDPMKAENWYKYPHPVFTNNIYEGVYGPGHASVTVGPDGKELWLVYHAMDKTYQAGNNRTARVQRFATMADGQPVFPRAVGYQQQLDRPTQTTPGSETTTTPSNTPEATTSGAGYYCKCCTLLLLGFTAALIKFN